ncbi:MAG TPA: MaoC family dehydratase N-terminal domain-containing protein [Burkholderiales bacterium]|nr:MaoC family dehydratase N-terminal domain-containing protein [Burkholderiales bacterium]
MAHDITGLKKWLGEKETAVDYVTVPTVHRLSALLDRDDPFPKIGDPLPLGWHAILFPRVVRHSQIGPDGHPARGDFLPPVPLPRRMFAGKTVTFADGLRVGDEVRRESTIQQIESKEGRTGPMVFVTVKTDIYSPRGLAITELQNIVYRDHPKPGASPPQPQPAPMPPKWEQAVTPDTVMLFRFSALTYNGHRIHYDLPYVTGVENYPGLIVNGGLTTLMMFELARGHAGRPVARFSSRNVSPLFVGRTLRVCGAPAEGGKLKLWVVNDQGELALTADAELA